MAAMDYAGYLALLDSLCSTLDQLAGVEREKTAAVRGDDLKTLNECMKKEQAFALSLRGLEQKRLPALAQLGLGGVPLGGLAAHYPADMQLKARETVERLQSSYRVYASAAEVARSTLECNLHQIEKIIRDMGVDPADNPGPPPSMRTDIRT